VNGWKRILILWVTLMLFLGSVGINVFRHTCEEDGTFTSYFVPWNDHCSEKKKETLPPCCQKNIDKCKGDLKVDNQDCCSDEYSYLQFQTIGEPTEQYQKAKLKFASTPLVLACKEIETGNRNYLNIPQKKWPPPPKKSGIDRLIFIRVLRI
jgi:hypothetical protein